MPNAVVWTSYPQDMVFYYLTPARFRRYSSSNLCPALPSLGRFRIQRTGGGIWLVNPATESCLSNVRSAVRPTGAGRPSAVSALAKYLPARLEAVPFQNLRLRNQVRDLNSQASNRGLRNQIRDLDDRASTRSASCSN